jgi:hypothetical protein
MVGAVLFQLLLMGEMSAAIASVAMIWGKNVLAQHELKLLFHTSVAGLAVGGASCLAFQVADHLERRSLRTARLNLRRAMLARLDLRGAIPAHDAMAPIRAILSEEAPHRHPAWSKSECPVCLAMLVPVRATDEADDDCWFAACITVPPCGHALHTACACRIVLANNVFRCPLCRAPAYES